MTDDLKTCHVCGESEAESDLDSCERCCRWCCADCSHEIYTEDGDPVGVVCIECQPLRGDA